MTPDQQALREAAERATKGEWQAVEMTHYGESGTGFWDVETRERDITEGACLTEADARYIALAHPQAVLALLDRIAELEQAISRRDKRRGAL